jgi:hypothetical protein
MSAVRTGLMGSWGTYPGLTPGGCRRPPLRGWERVLRVVCLLASESKPMRESIFPNACRAGARLPFATLRVGGTDECVRPHTVRGAYTPTGWGLVASNCRNTYCRMPPFA